MIHADASSLSALPMEVRGSSRWPLGMSHRRFLRNYWQKHPLLIRSAFAGFTPPIEASELAGLACEEGVLARLIHHDGARQDWQVKNGPLSEADFAVTGDVNWTVLVQDVDKWDAKVAALLAFFAFVPSWRVDDVMVSYAEPGGGVGAHLDHYDVFLLQGSGQRHWAISTDPLAPKACRPDLDLKQLIRFIPTHQWLLEPGDMLYLPPEVPHDGVALDEPCMTFSIGMRAPSQAELVGDLADYLAERLGEDQRYTDPDLAPVRNAGEIDQAALTRLKTVSPLTASLNSEQLRDWFGRFISRYRNTQTPASPGRPLSATSLKRQLRSGARLWRHPWSRMAWSQGRHGDTTLYANGQAWPATPTLAISLCDQQPFHPPDKPDAIEQALLLALVNEGHLVVSKPQP